MHFVVQIQQLIARRWMNDVGIGTFEFGLHVNGPADVTGAASEANIPGVSDESVLPISAKEP